MSRFKRGAGSIPVPGTGEHVTMNEIMHKNLSVLGFFFASLLAIGFVAASLELALKKVDPKYNYSEKFEVYRDESGNPKYAMGGCTNDTSCVPTGCGLEYCANEGIASTCEVKADHPANAGYKCGCLDQMCVWIR